MNVSIGDVVVFTSNDLVMEVLCMKVNANIHDMVSRFPNLADWLLDHDMATRFGYIEVSTDTTDDGSGKGVLYDYR